MREKQEGEAVGRNRMEKQEGEIGAKNRREKQDMEEQDGEEG